LHYNPTFEKFADIFCLLHQARQRSRSDWRQGHAVQLEDKVRDETSHAEETERTLCEWPL